MALHPGHAVTIAAHRFRRIGGAWCPIGGTPDPETPPPAPVILRVGGAEGANEVVVTPPVDPPVDPPPTGTPSVPAGYIDYAYLPWPQAPVALRRATSGDAMQLGHRMPTDPVRNYTTDTPPFQFYDAKRIASPRRYGSTAANDTGHATPLVPDTFNSTEQDPYGGAKGDRFLLYDDDLKARPATLAVYDNPPTPKSAWMMADEAMHIRGGLAFGVDGFLVLAQSSIAVGAAASSSQSYQRSMWQMQAAKIAHDAGKPWRVILMLDGSTGATNADITRAVTSAIGLLTAAGGALYKRSNGVIPVATYGPEYAPSNGVLNQPAYWKQLHDAFQSRGWNVKFLMCYSAANPWYSDMAGTHSSGRPFRGAAAYDPSIIDGHGRWTTLGRNPVDSASTSVNGTGLIAKVKSDFPGKTPLMNVSPADMRRATGSGAAHFNESGGTANIRASWKNILAAAKAGDETPIVQLGTWDDLGESSHWAASTRMHWVYLLLNDYYDHAWRMGAFPPINRDCLLVCHRLNTQAAPTSGTPSPQPPHGYSGLQFWPTRTGGTAFSDKVDIVAFAKEGTTDRAVRYKINGAQEYAATHASKRDPDKYSVHTPTLKAGHIDVEMYSTVTGEVFTSWKAREQVIAVPWVPDYQYSGGVSLHQELGMELALTGPDAGNGAWTIF